MRKPLRHLFARCAALLLLVPALLVPVDIWHAHHATAHAADACPTSNADRDHHSAAGRHSPAAHASHDSASHDPAQDGPAPHDPSAPAPGECQACWLATLAVHAPPPPPIVATGAVFTPPAAAPAGVLLCSIPLPITGRGPPALI